MSESDEKQIDPASELEALSLLGKQLLSNTADFDIDGFEQYASRLQRLLGTVDGDFEEAHEGALEALSKVHTEVVARAEKAVQLTGGELRSLKAKEKGLMRYIDTLPKKISSRRTRKG